MKNYLLFTLFLAFSSMANAQIWRGSISGEGSVIEKEITLDAFDGVRSGISGDIYLTQGAAENVRLEGQENILDNLVFEIRGSTLVIKNDKNVRNAKRVKIYITMPTLKEVAVSGSGNLSCTGPFNDLSHVDVAVSGSGDIQLEMDATDVEARISGSGSVELSGNANGLGARISGSGQVHAYDFLTHDVEVSISGSGDAFVNTDQSIDAKISGSGNVIYMGDAPKVYSRVSGSGRVKSR